MSVFGIARWMRLCLLAAMAAMAAMGGPSGVPTARAQPTGITHTLLFTRVLPEFANREVIVWETVYAAGARNPCHTHPAAITFHVLSGTGVWQESGKAPLTLHAGDSLFAPAGTTHAHWNPGPVERLVFLEFITAEKDKGRAIPRADAK